MCLILLNDGHLFSWNPSKSQVIIKRSFHHLKSVYLDQFEEEDQQNKVKGSIRRWKSLCFMTVSTAFQGGAWCSDIKSCAERANSTLGSTAMEEAINLEQVNWFKGMMSQSPDSNPGKDQPVCLSAPHVHGLFMH